jgi:hypothetical protein
LLCCVLLASATCMRIHVLMPQSTFLGHVFQELSDFLISCLGCCMHAQCSTCRSMQRARHMMLHCRFHTALQLFSLCRG